MHDDRPVVEEHPTGIRLAFHVQGTHARLVAERVLDRFGDRPDLTLTASATDDKVIGDDRDRLNVQQDDFARLTGFNDLKNAPCERLRVQVDDPPRPSVAWAEYSTGFVSLPLERVTALSRPVSRMGHDRA